MTKVGDYVRLKEGHEREYNRYSYSSGDDEMVKLYKEQGSLRDTSDIGVVTQKNGSDATVEGFTRLIEGDVVRRIAYVYRESALVKVDEVVKKQIQWFFCAGGSSAGAKAGGAAPAPVNAAAITDVAFFGFGVNSRDDLLHMMFLCLCLGKPTAANNKPESLFVDCKMSFKQFMHGLSIVGNPADKAALKAAMEAYEAKAVVNYRNAPGADYKLHEGCIQPGAYRRFWDNMYWVLSGFPGLKCPERINDAFNKKDLLFVDCLKIGFDLLPQDHPHKEAFSSFMLEVKAPEFRSQASAQLQSAITKDHMVTKFREEGYKHFVTAFNSCNGTIAFHEWTNVWLLGNIGPAPQFTGWDPSFNMPVLDKVVRDYVMANIDPSRLEDDMEEGDD